MNPYSPPGAQSYPYPPAVAYQDGRTPGVSDPAIDILRQTRPWAMMFSVLCFLGSGFMLLVSAVVILTGSSFGAASKSSYPSAIGLIYLPFASLYIYPGLKLWAYAGAIGRLVVSRSSADLESALLQQKSFWKYSGIAAIAVVIFYFFGMLTMLAVWQFLAPTKH